MAVEYKDFKTQTTPEAQQKRELYAKLEKRIKFLQQHMKWREQNRAFVNMLEDALKPLAECVLYLDFAKYYNTSGAKVKDLIIVVVWRNEDGDMVRSYIDNFFMGASKASCTHDILERLLSDPTCILSSFQTIYITGDTGNGFRSYESLYFFSCAVSKFKKKIALHFLCPRHAFSLCDAHGGNVGSHVEDIKHSSSLYTAEQYCAVVQEAGLKNTTAYAHKV